MFRILGRALFEKDSSLVTSDAKFVEEGEVSVDASQYTRVELGEEAEPPRIALADLSDSD